MTVLKTWMDAKSEQELYTIRSWTGSMDKHRQMDGIMMSGKLETKKIQVLEFDWSRSDHSAVFSLLSRGCDTQRNLE